MITAAGDWTTEAARRTGATPVDLLEADLQDGSGAPAPFRIWTGLGDLSWDGKSWSGIGRLINIDPVPSTAEGEPAGVQIELAATEDTLSTVATHRTHGRQVKIWRGWLLSSGSLITPLLTATLVLDEITIDDGPGRPVVRATAIDVLADLDRPRLRRLAPETQARRDPTDKGFEYVASMARAEINVAGGYFRRDEKHAG